MPPFVPSTAWAIPWLPFAPTPTGKLTVVEAPTLLRNVPETSDRYRVNAYVSPDPSERQNTVILVCGIFTPLFRFLICLLFQVVIWPR